MDEKELRKEIRSAIRDGAVEKVVGLINSNKEQLNAMTTFGTWLHVAASRGKLEIVERLVEMGADVNAYGGIVGGGPIGRAASEGHLEIVRYLLDHGAKLDVSEPTTNPLFAAIFGGHVDVARLLVESGIDTRVKYTGESMKDMDALAFARERGQREIEKLLLTNRGE